MTSIKLSSLRGYEEVMPIKKLCLCHNETQRVSVTVDIEELAKALCNSVHEWDNWDDQDETGRRICREDATRLLSSLPSILKLQKGEQ